MKFANASKVNTFQTAQLNLLYSLLVEVGSCGSLVRPLDPFTVLGYHNSTIKPNEY